MKICVCLCVYSLPSFVFDSEIHVSSINFINGKRFFCIYHIPNSFPKLKSVPVCLECCYLKYCILSKSFCLKYGITLTLIHISAILFQKLVIDLKKKLFLIWGLWKNTAMYICHSLQVYCSFIKNITLIICLGLCVGSSEFSSDRYLSVWNKPESIHMFRVREILEDR